MNKQSSLIEEMCPSGVSFVRMDSCCKLEKGATPIQKATPGPYPLVVTSSDRKTSENYQFDKPSVCVPLISSRGHGVASLSQIFYQEDKFALGNILCAVTPYDEQQLSARFLFYYLNYKKDILIVPLMRGGANVSLSVDSLSGIKIPLPPLSVQNEIVSILDTFESFLSTLQKESLLRKKQYEYYRNELLTFGGSIPRMTIQNICTNVSSGGTPNSKVSEYYGGDIPWLRTQEVVFGPITNTGMTITSEGLKNSSAKWIPEHCVIMAMYGATVGKVGYNLIPLTTNQACCNLQIDEQKAYYKYVYYWLENRYEYVKSLGQGSQTNINAKIVKELEIALPDLQTQKNIASILDTLHDFSLNDNSVINAEISARRTQFDYYRGKLLAF